MRVSARIAFLSITILMQVRAVAAQDVVVRQSPSRLVVVANGPERRIEAYRTTDLERIWRFDGPRHPRTVVFAPSGRGAVLDAVANSATIFSDRGARSLRVGETPVAALFVGETLFVACRDSRSLEKIDESGTRQVLPTASDVSAAATSGRRIYLYSRVDGTVEEFGSSPFRSISKGRIAPFASDLVLDDKVGYLSLPQSGEVVVFSLETLKITQRVPVGAVPVDLELERPADTLSARTLAVADPSSKRIWRTEGAQSDTAAFTRGFVRGLIGMGLYSPRSSSFPTGVDRIRSNGRETIAFDSSSATLYQVTKKGSRQIARDIGSEAFDLTSSSVLVWQQRLISYPLR
ncbi:MAG TPA: hypothetical protein VNM92_09585 [Thermoanaerobaculia bacterium]|nr:hypothetical protein [Thermoanaerobaculia bacterium]